LLSFWNILTWINFYLIGDFSDVKSRVSHIKVHLLKWPNNSKGLFIWAKVIPVSEKTFRQVYERDLALLRK
jgi:hypothetical protein